METGQAGPREERHLPRYSPGEESLLHLTLAANPRVRMITTPSL